MKGTIILTLEGVSLEETERCRKIIHALFEEGFFNVKSGSFTANFDELGEMLTIEKRLIRRRNKPIIGASEAMTQYKIEVLPIGDKPAIVAKRI